MDKSLILNTIKRHYNLKNNVEFANFLGISPQALSNWYSRGSIDYDLVYTKCLNLSGDWLLSGIGDIARNSSAKTAQEPAIIKECCSSCKEKEVRIAELKDHISTLKAQISSMEKRSAPSNTNYSQTA